MASSLTWLAHSEAERRQTQEVMRLLEEPGTVDEMGMGRIRDALANLLFPGTSTLHTRARYFLFIPWIYKDLERSSPVENSAQKARRREIDLIAALKRQRELEEGELVDGAPLDDWGIIGEQAGASLVQLPSQAYWNGLHVWGVRANPGSRALCHRMLSQRDLRRPALDDDGQALPGALGSWWDTELPEAPRSLRRCATFALSHQEAVYLKGRATIRLAGKALAELLELGTRVDGDVAIWELGDEVLGGLSKRSRNLIEMAKRFSLAMNGASLLYNLMLAEQAERPETEDDFRQRIERWCDEVDATRAALREWREHLPDFWQIAGESNPRVPSTLERHFVEHWTDLALSHSASELVMSDAARRLVGDRERQLKRSHARLGNASALQDWGGSSGAARLNFRWPFAANLINDIVDGIERGSAADA